VQADVDTLNRQEKRNTTQISTWNLGDTEGRCNNNGRDAKEGEGNDNQRNTEMIRQ
jgi:hypothetical protein